MSVLVLACYRRRWLVSTSCLLPFPIGFRGLVWSCYALVPQQHFDYLSYTATVGTDRAIQQSSECIAPDKLYLPWISQVAYLQLQVIGRNILSASSLKIFLSLFHPKGLKKHKLPSQAAGLLPQVFWSTCLWYPGVVLAVSGPLPSVGEQRHQPLLNAS